MRNNVVTLESNTDKILEELNIPHKHYDDVFNVLVELESDSSEEIADAVCDIIGKYNEECSNIIQNIIR